MKFTFYHNNINVFNLERSLAFYKKALGLCEIRRREGKDFTLAFLGDGKTFHSLELTYLHDRTQPYNLGENEIHLAFRTDDFDGAYALHKEMGCICYENHEMGIYFIADPDGYWIEILPEAKKMLKHIVFWEFLDSAEGASKEENMTKVRDMLYALTDKIPQIKSMNISPSIGGEYDMCLETLFEDEEELLIYQEHPEHRKVSAFVSKVRGARSCCDFYV